MLNPIRSHLLRSALAATLISAGATAFAPARASAQHEGHDMQQAKPKPRPSAKKSRKPRKKATRTRRRPTPRPRATPARAQSQRARPNQNQRSATTQAQEAAQPDHSGHSQAGTTKQAVGATGAQASPTPTPAAAAPAPHDHSQHGQQRQAGEEGKAEGARPTPAPTTTMTPAPMPAPAAQDPHAGHTGMQGGAGATKPAEGRGAATPPAGAVDHSAHGGAAGGGAENAKGADAGGLMVTSGGGMSIRVGDSRTRLLPMGQMGSGTSWQPSSSPMYMWHRNEGEWFLMLHGEAKIGVNSQGGPRGVTKFESQNWLMPMAFRKVGRGTLQLRGMFSIEPLTFSGAGSPQLFQAGETYQGRTLVDFQHPHDLFMEMSATYTVPVGEHATWYAYLGFPGEPALGPVAFMHRPSASENPTAPLSHHLQDSTHISFGVLTSGFTYRWLKFEGSVFNGREPDERRYNLEFNPWNSRSVRVTVAPNANWAVQYSYGFLKDPEALAPGDVHRQTASVQYNRPFERGNLAAALLWGRNRSNHDGRVLRTNGYTAEATVNFLDKNYAYTRLELADREELLEHDELHDAGFGEGEHPIFRIGAYTFGAARDLWDKRGWSFALGGDFTFYSKPDVLDSLYGRNPTSYKLFLRIRPSRMKHDAQGGHTGHGGN